MILGSKGTTGTQASFLELFDGDQETMTRLDQRIADKMGFSSAIRYPDRPTPEKSTPES